MEFKTIQVFFLWFVVSVHGQTKYCCTPAKWESVNLITDARVDTTGSKKPIFTEGSEAVSVDQTGHKIASLSTLTSGGFKVNVQVIQLFDQGTMYTVQSGECKSSKLPAWTPVCVPDNATKSFSAYYGAADNKVNTDIYSLTMGPNFVSVGVSPVDCTPLFVSAYGSAEGVSAKSAKIYTNVTLGIKDSSVFDVPSICANVSVHHDTVPVASWY